MLTTGLTILRLLVEAEGSLTATAIADRVGLHPSNVSRTLRVLIEAGYVRKPHYHRFAPDLGVLALSGVAAWSLPECRLTAAPLAAFAAAQPQWNCALGALVDDQILYLHRLIAGQPPMRGATLGYPLHQSAVALRLLAAEEPTRAREALERSRRRYGWPRPTPLLPGDPATCCSGLADLISDGVCCFDGWNAPGLMQAAGMVTTPSGRRLAVAVDGTGGSIDDARRLAQALTADLHHALHEDQAT